MPNYFTVASANELLGEAREVLLLLRSQRREVVALSLRYRELTGQGVDDADAPERGVRGESTGEPEGTPTTDLRPAPVDLEEAQLLRLRIRGIVDQMGAAVTRLDGWGLTLRDIRSGLVDFPTLVGGEPAWLCWRLEDGDRIGWWHDQETGVAGRRPIEELH